MIITARKVTNDNAQIKAILDEAGRTFSALSLDQAPAEITWECFKIATRLLGINDPYKEEKYNYDLAAMRLLPRLRKALDDTDNRLRVAIGLAIAANMIDLGIVTEPNLDDLVERAMTTVLAIDDSDELIRDLNSSGSLLYIGDNAGEIGFDMLLIEELKKLTNIEVRFAVKGGPVMNDATIEDAMLVGLSEVADVITTGSNYLGVSCEKCSPAFVHALKTAGVVIAKGHANFETMPDCNDRTYHLLTVKCEPVAKELGVRILDSVLWRRM
ncbi:MAG TPA: DUF89 family protein [Firmicutes bacterium]|nr:DUF89 family protein [Bacillota bacterium]